MRKIVVTFTIALSLGAASTIANAQPAAPATNASAAASTTAAANNNQTTAAKTSTPAAAQSSAAASSSAPAVVPPKGDNKSNKDKSGQNKKSGNNVGSTLGIIAAIAAVLGLVGGGIFWAIQQNLIPNIQLPNIPGLPTNIPNPFAPPAPAPAPAPTSSAAPAPAE